MSFKKLAIKVAVGAAISIAVSKLVASSSAPKQKSEKQDTEKQDSKKQDIKPTSSAGTAASTSVAADQLAIDEAEVGTILEKKELVTSEIISAPNGSATWLVKYGSRNAHGTPIAVTGLVTIPNGEAPEGGWPVLSWAHGTTGIAKESAPSQAINSHPDEEALVTVAHDYLQTWLDKDFAVIQPDYEGLGTVGHGTYMDRHSLASSVNELVEATRGEFSFAESWYNTGWSQGGFAAVSAASAEKVPSGLKQTFAIAPGDTQVPGGDKGAEKADEMFDAVDAENLTYGAYAVQGAMNFNSDIVPDDFLNDNGKKVLELASALCLTTFKEENTIAGKDILKENPDLSALIKHMNANSMVNMHPTTPVTIFISEDDEIITYEQISNSAKKLSENEGTDVEVIVHTGESHRDMVRRAIEDQKPYAIELQ